jgi:hypothetical protein
MPSRRLFSRDEALVPDVRRGEPVLWLRRLVILADRGIDTPLREITFRRGLNIVQTNQRRPDESHVVGHSVGKTLLTRLIRYTLGEHYFAVESVRARILQELASAWVVAHWRVNSQDWVVARPFQESRAAKSFAVEASAWQAAFQGDESREPFEAFLTAVTDTVLSGLPGFTLPKSRRSPKWSDVLGWIARDHECGYRAPNEWRHGDADSGASLDRSDNSYVLQWLMGLMGTEETEMNRRHQGLLEDRQRSVKARDAGLKENELVGRALSRKLGLPDDDAAHTTPGDLFAPRVVEQAEEKISALNRLKAERIAQSRLTELQSAEAEARSLLNVADEQVRDLERRIAFVQGQLRQIETSASANVYALGSRFEDCPEQGCPMRVQNRPSPPADPAKDHRLTTLQEELVGYQSDISEKKQVCDELRKAHVHAGEQLTRERDRLSTETVGIDRDIGRWESYREEAQGFVDAARQLRQSTDAIEQLSRKIDESSQRLTAVRQNLKAQRNRLSDCYAHVLRDIFGDEADGSIVVDGWGLHPSPDSRLAPNGAALSVMATVLAFDASCMAASMVGFGSHPRLLIHDSPREGDMEEPLFHRLFEMAVHLESLFLDREPSFQYIVTTTSPPPATLASEDGPYVRLTLDARIPQGRLLKRVF